jgi:hypothetical protein
MFDKIMFEKICKLSCTFDELKRFNSKIDEKEFDVDNCFEKYYSLDTILKCIQLHKDKRISGKHLAYWSNAYDWIIMGGFKGKESDENDKNISLATILIFEISDWLDSLSFYSEDYDYNLDEYSHNFRVLDSIYKNREKWHAFYSFSSDTYDNGDSVNDITVLLVNDAKKVYYTLYSDGCDFKEYIFDKSFTETPNTEELESDLKSKGYKEL